MLRRLIAVATILLALAACETATEETGAAAGGGTGSTDGASVSTLPQVTSSSSGYSSAPTSGLPRGNLGPAELERELVSVGDTVYFATDSYSLDSQGQETLDRQAALLLRNTSSSVTIEGHADERGVREYNIALGERRATSVKDYLVAFGINPARIRTISYGEERPAVVGSNEAAWAKNRRAVTVVTGGAAGS